MKKIILLILAALLSGIAQAQPTPVTGVTQIVAGTNVTISPSSGRGKVTINASGGGDSGTVTSVSVATANGVSGTVATATTTPAITLTLDAISPSSISIGADPADVGDIRLVNAGIIAWEASPAGTDVTFTVNSSEQFVFSNDILSPSLATSLLTSSTTFALLNTTATTVNAFGAATTMNFGATSSTANFLGTVNTGTASGVTGAYTLTGATSGSTKYTTADATAQAIIVNTAAQTVGGATVTIPDLAGASQTYSFIGKAETLSGAKTFSGGVLASGANANDFSGGSGTFKTSTGAVTIGTGAVGITGALTITGPAATTGLTFTQTARTSGILPYIKYTIPTDTAQTAATESPGIQGVTGTRTWATTGTVALQREIFFPGPTYASASASQTFTDAFNMYLTPPVAGTNAIFTRGHTLGVVDSTSAASSITGAIVVSTTLGTTATSVGIGGGNINAGGAVTVGGALTATAGTNSIAALVDAVDGTTPLNNIPQTVASGTAYTLTATSAAVAFGTTSPIITFSNAGTYWVSCDIQYSYVGATFAANRQFDAKLRRTNNTAADVSGSAFSEFVPVLTTITDAGPHTHIGPVLYSTANTTDTVQVFADISVLPTAGSVTVSACTITAMRAY